MSVKVTLTFPPELPPAVADGAKATELEGSPVGVSLGPQIGTVWSVKVAKDGTTRITVELDAVLDPK